MGSQAMDGGQDLEVYRPLFPITEKGVAYFNHAGVSPPSRRVCSATSAWMSASAQIGVDFEAWEEGAESCRERFARLIGCSSSEVAFVRNTSHGLSLVAEGLPWRSGERIVVSSEVEYPSNVHPWVRAARCHDLIVDDVSPRDGGIDVDRIAQALRPDTRLVAVSSAQYGTGAITDLAALGQLCGEQNVLLCVDGIQTLGAIPIDVKELGIHFLSADSHKWLLGTMGIGAAYFDRDLISSMRPALVGWKSMVNGWDFLVERDQLLSTAGRFEEGSPAYALIAGFLAALELIEEISVEAISARMLRLVDYLATGLEKLGCVVGPERYSRHHIVCFSHPGVTTEILRKRLIDQRIIVSERGNGIRVSPHFYNTIEEIDRLLAVVKNVDLGRLSS